jgi:hypothetical protein
MWAEIGSIMVMGGNRAFFLIYHMIKGFFSSFWKINKKIWKQKLLT